MKKKTRTQAGRRPRPSKKPERQAESLAAAEPAAADRARFLDPFDDQVLLYYYDEILRWHGYIRFLGLPHLRDNPDVPIDRLYVEPSISDSHIQPERPIREWPDTTPVLQAVAASRRLVLLGDPGSGKSTLVSWIAWQLTQPGDSAWTKRLGRLVPIPMILRDMTIGRDITWDGLLDAFLALPVAKPLNEDGKGRERLADLLERGQAIIMLDGLDEIGSTAVRDALREAVFHGTRQTSRCRWLLTSRIVGYGKVPFDQWYVRYPELVTATAVFGRPSEDIGIADLRYVAPFSDAQIEQFAHNWYIQHEQAEHERQQRARELVEAIGSNEGTRDLARIPNLLTLIALIYRVYRWLPHGRAMLYDRIAEAYLESIDRFRGLKGVDYPLVQKKRWLAYVGYQMQLRRGEQGGGGPVSRGSEQREILVDEEQVLRWIAEAMGETAAEDAEASARRFVDYIARRSGLLLPRGEGQFAFTHLSLQEYFAACYCAEQVTAGRWLEGRAKRAAFSPDDLRGYANRRHWRETLILLFEALAERGDWPDDLVECLYGEGFSELAADTEGRKLDAALLLADVCLDRHSGLSPECREGGLVACWRWQIILQQTEDYFKRRYQLPPMAHFLLSAKGPGSEAVWTAFDVAAADLGTSAPVRVLDFIGCPITDAGLAHVSALTSLQRLDLWGCTQITDAGLAHLSALTSLQWLDLSDTWITDAGPEHLSGCTKLKSLYTDGTKVTEAGKKRFFESIKRK
ncbi:MAG: hypothetical protein JXQ75_14720 [Phycisphaerae bacterium]|nr:hypothetical protein [Phycisphaerae bacterium]